MLAPAAPAQAPAKHLFPLKGRWTTRGPIGDFGAPRNGGRIHEGFDVVGRCGAKLVAVTDGRVVRRGFDPVLYGNYVLLADRNAPKTYFYAHMVKPTRLDPTDKVEAGQRVGNEGKTGNAETVGCHLHFELRVKGKPIDPEPYLRKWDSAN